MGQKYERTLNAILQEPVSGNIHWREVESLLKFQRFPAVPPRVILTIFQVVSI